MAEAYDMLLKLVLAGESQCGKSGLLSRYVRDTFQEEYVGTIGVEFATKSIKICGKCVKLQIWDTAGQDRFKSISRAYYRGASGVLLVCDITNEKSFQSLEEKLDEVKEGMNEHGKIVILANKCDCEDRRQVTEQQLQKLALRSDLELMYVSAKTGENVTEAFELLATKIIEEMASNIEGINVVH